MLEALIFDMDGVLVNSTRYIWDSFNVLLKSSGVQLSDEEMKKYLGCSLRDKLRRWKEDYGIKEYDLEEFSREAGEAELELVKKNVKPDEALITLLKEAKDYGVRLAVATSSLRWRAEKMLDLLQIRSYFNAVITAEDVENHKPDPDIFLEAAKQLGIAPGYCVVFEDAANGLEAARRGGMKCVAVKTEFQSREDLKEADLIITDFSEVSIGKLRDLF
jgi:HAD superfamily hydrolase (TIGR01509 family)